MEGISLFSKFRLLIYFKCRAGSFKIVYLNWMWPQLCSFGSIFTASSGNIKATLGRASAPNSEMLLLFGLSRQLLLWLIQMSLSFKPLIILQVCYHQFLFVFFSKLVIKLSALVFKVWSWTSCACKTREGNWARRNPADDLWATITY